MECIDPTALPAGALAEFALDPENDDARVLQHIAQCAFCAGEVSQMRELSQRLGRRLQTFDCPDVATIDAFVASELDPAAARAVEEHLRICLRCTGDVRMARAALSAEEPLLSWSAPGSPPLLAQTLRRLVAVLVTPNPGARPAAAIHLRGADEIAEPRVYQVEGVSIALRDAESSPAPGGQRTFDGILSVADDPAVANRGITIRVLDLAAKASEPVAETQAEFGAFTLGPLAPGRYQVIFTIGDREVVIDDLAV
jgi:hypothetical protein